MAIDFTSPLGQVRLLSTDIDEQNPVLEDDALLGLLALEQDNVRLAAAQALDIVASSETLVLKKLQTLDVTTDGPAVAVSLRNHAATLRKQVSDGFDGGGDFDVADMVVDVHTLRERIIHEFERDSASGLWPIDPEFLF